nr:MAG TPA: hypothetical protein [Caudoviricetes sp.]DAJ29924.1 MAG TPA: hypothetical protein [Bacteriophage sp.]DAT15543.1 MAG TPA: hypothetical protein [Caudoviricetes sp.]
MNYTPLNYFPSTQLLLTFISYLRQWIDCREWEA